MSAVLLLNSSCQAVIEAEIHQVSSPWYDQLDQELGAAEELVIQWRRSGFVYFQSEVLDSIDAAGQAFAASKAQIDGLYASLRQSFSAELAAQLVAALQALEPPVQAISDQIAAYLARLARFEQQMEKPHSQMQTTIAEVQAEEESLKAQIDAINQQIASLQQQVQVDRDAIAKAQSSRRSGILETIFGVILAPISGGLSLVLVGIGVASIAEAQALIDQMQSQIQSYQQTIAGDAQMLSQDKATIATLNGLTLSTGLVLSDMDGIEKALDSLRASWTALGGELANVVDEVRRATSSQEVIVSQAWYDSACSELALVVQHVDGIRDPDISTRRVVIG
ncbi:non-hemolytic enterotoxin lytic component L1 [Sorangium sp. So ce1128]